jgi:hypothetical protein
MSETIKRITSVKVDDLTRSVLNYNFKLLSETPGVPGPQGDPGDPAATPIETYLGSPMMMIPAAGEFIGNIHSGTLTTLKSAANRMQIAPFLSAFDFSIDQIGVSVSTGVAGSACGVIFNSDSLGRPTTLAAQGADVDTTTAATRMGAVTFTFQKGKLYWIGNWTSADCTLRCAQTYAHYPITWTSAATPAREAALRRVVTYGAATTWVYEASQHTTVSAPFTLMRMA